MEPKHAQNVQDPLNAEEGLIPWEDLLDTVFHHRRLIVAVCAIGITLSVFWAWATPPMYQGRAMMLVKDNRAQMAFAPADARTRMPGPTDDLEQINSLAALIRSPALIEEVLNSFQKGTGSAEEEESFVVWLQDRLKSIRWKIQGVPGQLYRWAHGLPPPTAMEYRVAKVLGHLWFEPVPESNLVVVTYRSRSPEWAARFTNRLVDTLISKYTTLHEHTGAHRFYEDQRTLLANRVAEARSELSDFREDVGSDLLSVNMAEIQQRIADLEIELLTDRTRRAEFVSLANVPLEAIVADAALQDAEAGTVANPAILALKGRLVELEIQRSELLSRYTEGSVAVKDLDRQIMEANRLLENERSNSVRMHRKTAQAKIDVVDAKIAALNGQLESYRDTLMRLEDVLPQLLRLENNVRTQQEAYVTYSRKEEEARLSSALDDSQIVNIAIAERAQVPNSPVAAGTKKRVAFGAAFSMILAVGLAMFRDFTDPSVKTAAQAVRITGLPVLGQIHG
jgi:uncharacterized protein involved in exopolysaccharide biosynthesis